MNNYLILSLFIATLIAGYAKGYTDSSNSHEKALTELRVINQANIMALTEKHIYEQNRAIQSYIDDNTKMKESYEQIISDINATKLSNTTKCVSNTSTSTRVSKANTNKSNLICYTETDIRTKIKESMDIGRECDELAIKYNTLLSICNNQGDIGD